MPEWIVQLIIPVIQSFLTRITPEIRKGLEEFAFQLHARAEKTPNPWDNILVGIIFALLKLNTPQ